MISIMTNVMPPTMATIGIMTPITPSSLVSINPIITLVLVVKNLFDLGKADNQIAKTKENLKQKRSEYLKAFANEPREEKNI